MPSLHRLLHREFLVKDCSRRDQHQVWIEPAQSPDHSLALQPDGSVQYFAPGSHHPHTARRVILSLLLGLGMSLVGSAATALQAADGEAEFVPTPAVHTVAPRSLGQSSFAAPLAQQVTQAQQAPTQDSDSSLGEAEAIEGDSEARLPSTSKGSIYAPIRLRSGQSIQDTLTTKDIPMGQGSFARDYVVTLKAKDQIAIDLFSDSFDTVVTLMSENGTTLGENDDGPDGGTNSLLFMRITEDGNYVVRVRGFGQAKGGPFKLKLTRLKASD